MGRTTTGRKKMTTLMSTSQTLLPSCIQTSEMDTEWQVSKKSAKLVKEDPPQFKIQVKNKFQRLLEVPDVPKSGDRIPPIIMTAVDTHRSMVDLIKKFISDFTMSYVGQNNVKIQCKSFEDYCKLREGFKLDQQRHTFSGKEEMELKAIIHGLPKMPEAEIMEDIINQGLPVSKVIQMKNKEPKNNATEQYLVFFKPSVAEKELKEIKYICYAKVDVEKYRNNIKNITSCNRQTKCVKCLGTHLSTLCNQGMVTPAVFSGCSEPRPTNYKECPKNQTNLKVCDSRKNRATPVNDNPWKIPVLQTIQNIPVANDQNFPMLPTTSTLLITTNIPTILQKPQQKIDSNIQPTSELTSIASIQKVLKILQEIRTKASGCTDKLQLALMLVEYFDAFD